MDAKSLLRCRKWSTIIGCYILVSTTGFIWYWGNMSVYVESLILSYQAPSSYILAPWTASIYLISSSVGFLACGAMLRCTSVRIVIVVGTILGTCGKLLSAFAVLHSMTFFNATMGFILGLGNGVVNSAGLQCAALWADNDVAFLMAVVQSSTNVAGILTNQFVTFYVNPRGETADTTVEGLQFFSQDDVIGNVESLILVLGCGHFVFKIIGFGMIRVKNAKNTAHYGPEPIPVELNESSTILKDERSQSNNGSIIIPQPENPTAEMTSLQIEKEQSTNGSMISQPEKSSTSIEMTSLEMLRSKEFYLILFAFLSIETALLVIINYYKVFGQLYIKDDHFLTNIGTYMSITGLGGKLFWGYVTDRIGVKYTLVILLSILVTFGSFYFLTILVSKWMYTFFTVLLCSSTGTFSLFSGFIGKQFGKENFSSNFGVLNLCLIALLLALPAFADVYVSYFGWFSLAFTSTAPAVLSLILVIFFMPNEN